MALKTATAREEPESRDAAADGPLMDGMASAVKKMLARGKERGYVTYDEINSVMPLDQVSFRADRGYARHPERDGHQRHRERGQRGQRGRRFERRQRQGNRGGGGGRGGRARGAGRQCRRGRAEPDRRPGADVSARDGQRRAPVARGRDRDRQADRGRAREDDRRHWRKPAYVHGPGALARRAHGRQPPSCATSSTSTPRWVVGRGGT